MPQVVIANAGNTQAPALAVLQEIGYVVSNVPGDSALLQADNGTFRLLANDPVELLGLASLALHRGAAWAPTDAEVSALLRLESPGDV